MKHTFSPLVTSWHEATGQTHLHAGAAFETGAVITPFFARETLALPTYLTLQTGPEEHILLGPEELQFCNHSCDPNAFFDTTAMALIALKDIALGDELTFFYPSTEWTMAQPFNCFCGSANCLGLISGAVDLTPAVLARYRMTDFILTQLMHRSALAAPAMV